MVMVLAIAIVIVVIFTAMAITMAIAIASASASVIVFVIVIIIIFHILNSFSWSDAQDSHTHYRREKTPVLLPVYFQFALVPEVFCYCSRVLALPVGFKYTLFCRTPP